MPGCPFGFTGEDPDAALMEDDEVDEGSAADKEEVVAEPKVKEKRKKEKKPVSFDASCSGWLWFLHVRYTKLTWPTS